MGTARKVIPALALLVCLVAAGCGHVIYVRKPGTRIYTGAVYESSKPYFLYGVFGPDYDVYVDEVCLGKDADQVATYYTPSNALVGMLTLGIYTPRTVGVWCRL